MEKIEWNIPVTSGDPISLPLEDGNLLFIIGANGSGKSALVQQFVVEDKSGNNKVKWITAHRQTWLESGDINFTPASRQEYEQLNLAYNKNYESRWKDFQPGQKLSAVLFDLVARVNARARSIADYMDKGKCQEAKSISAKSKSALTQINELLDLGTLGVKLENSNSESLQARPPKGQLFSIAEMSDGERSAVIIAAHVITADPGTVLLIDEPERHLHRSIIQPFLSALFNLRREDCAFIISTHEIALPIANPEAQVLMLRSCQWRDNQCVAWDAKVIEPNSGLPEELRRAILGSRKRILFVEGRSDSLDFSLYTTLFPDLSVEPMGSCEEVQKAVLGLRGSQDKHHVEAFGLIDRDDRMDEAVEKIAEKGVFALEVYSAEALYYCSDAIAAVARRQAESLGEDESRFIELAKQEAIEILKEHAERMAARRCERKIHQLLLQQAPNSESIKDNPVQQICVSVDSPYLEELNLFNELVENRELDRLIARYPVRESSVFATIAKALKCRHKNDYERMVIAQIRRDNGLAQKLKERIGPLSIILDQVGKPETK